MTPALSEPTRDKRDAALDKAEAALKRARRVIDVALRAIGQTTKDKDVISQIDAALADISVLRGER